MKSIPVFFSLFCCLSFYTHAQTTYDSVLAKKLNADDYGMKKYVLVILKTGPAPTLDSQKMNDIFHGHMQNIQNLASQNKLVVAGPLFDNGEHYEGIFVLNTDNIEDAKKMLDTDPAVHNNFLIAELFVWYGSAALQQIPDLHKKIQKKGF